LKKTTRVHKREQRGRGETFGGAGGNEEKQKTKKESKKKNEMTEKPAQRTAGAVPVDLGEKRLRKGSRKNLCTKEER